MLKSSVLNCLIVWWIRENGFMAKGFNRFVQYLLAISFAGLARCGKNQHYIQKTEATIAIYLCPQILLQSYLLLVGADFNVDKLKFESSFTNLKQRQQSEFRIPPTIIYLR